jgi:hypothetical protein
MTTVEHLRGGKVTSLVATRRTLTLASADASIAPGTHVTLKLKLGTAGRSLLRKFQRLPAELVLRSLLAPHARTVYSRNVTLRE